MSQRKPRPSRQQQPGRRPPGACPCGLPAAYEDCCGRLHRGAARAADPEELMRSRYTAFALHDEPYLLRTWHPRTRPPGIGFDPDLRWQRLDVLRSTGGGPFHGTGTVEFRAHYTHDGRPGSQHENSNFTLHEGAWVYVDGVTGA